MAIELDSLRNHSFFQLPSSEPSSRKPSASLGAAAAPTAAAVASPPAATAAVSASASATPQLKLPLRVEWECGDRVGVYIDDDEQALLMTAQDAVRADRARRPSTAIIIMGTAPPSSTRSTVKFEICAAID